MPGGSVTAKVSSVRVSTNRFVTSGSGCNHRNVLDLLNKFAVEDFKSPVYFGVELDNGIGVVINSDLVVTIKALVGKNMSGKITQVTAWRMKDEAVPSRCDAAGNEIWAISGQNNLCRMVLSAFATAPIRCLLCLELDNGFEINIYPSLKPDVPAIDEQGREEFDYESRPIWDVKVSIWPMFEDWFRLETALAESAK